MAYEKKHGDFVLFINDRKQGKAPDWKGTIYLDGKNHEFSAWNKVSKTGSNFMSGSLGLVKDDKPKDTGGWGNKTASKHSDDVKMPFDDDLPWK